MPDRGIRRLSTTVIIAALAIAVSCSDNGLDGGESGIRVGTPAPSQTATSQTPAPSTTGSKTPISAGPGNITPTPTTVEPTAISTTAAPTPGTIPTVTSVPENTPTLTTVPPTASPVPASVSPASTQSPAPTIEPLRPMQLERVFEWYSPARPTHMEEATDGSGRIFVSEQSGRIVEITGSPTAAEGGERVVLDIRQRVTGRANEEGLLGFALHPQFAENNHIFVYYSALEPRRSVISEFIFLDSGLIDPNSERVIMEVLQPQSNHNGGMLTFGPDGYLYISLGDGGGAGDQANNAQNTSNVLGSILRIDVDAAGVAYGIPADNPFAGTGGGAQEIWAYGLRNPWRVTFDMETGELWAGDVGQNRVEEIDLIVRGGNYGWRLKEGEECFNPSNNCEREGLIDPVVSYSHAFGCSVSGGYVYRNSRLPSLHGAYVYADFCSGIIWAIRHSSGELQEQAVLADSRHQIPAFGQTLDGEVYVLTYSPGIFRFVEP